MLLPGRPFHRWQVATQSENRQSLKEMNRQVREALTDCQQLMERTRELLRHSGQDNDRQLTD